MAGTRIAQFQRSGLGPIYSLWGVVVVLMIFLIFFFAFSPAANTTSQSIKTIDQFAYTITRKDVPSNLGLFAPGGTVNFGRLMTFLVPPPTLGIADWGTQLDVFLGGFLTNHMTLTNCNVTLDRVTCLGYYTYTFDIVTLGNLPTVISSFSANFQLDSSFKILSAEVLPNATSTYIWYSVSGVEPPGPILSKKRTIPPQVTWEILQAQLLTLVGNNETQQALSTCNTTQYLYLKAIFDPFGSNSSLPCNYLTVPPTLLTGTLVCSESGQIDASCFSNVTCATSIGCLVNKNISIGTIDQCTHGVIDESCLPPSIATLNMILPFAPTRDFTIIGGPGIGVTGGTNSLTIFNNINITIDGPVFTIINYHGNLIIILKNQTANTVFAGPVSGGSQKPTFRHLLPVDLPQLNLSSSLNFIGILPVTHGGTGVNGTYLIAGNGITVTEQLNGTLLIDWIGPAVLQVDLSAPTDIFNVTNGPVTVNGTLSFTTIPQLANTFWAGPISGPANIPSFRILTESDIPPLNISNLLGTLSVSHGGTGSNVSLVGGGIMVSLGTDQIVEGSLIGLGPGIILTMPNATTFAIGTTALLNASLSVPSSIFSLTVPTIYGPSSGTLAFDLLLQNPNRIWAGPSSGSPAIPTFRKLVNADIPSTLVLSDLSVTGSTLLGIATSCINPLLPSCYDISNQACTSGPLAANCIPDTLHISTLVVDSLIVINGSVTEMSYTNSSAFGEIMLNGTFSCSGNGSISNECLNLGGYTCPNGMPLAESCIPASIIFQDVSVLNNLTVNNVYCTGPPMDNACIPRRIKTINGILPTASPLLDFSILGSTGISIIPAVNGISVANTGVTSVDLSVPSAEFVVSGNPVTTTGTLAVTKQNQLPNTVWAGPVSGPAAQPTFRELQLADFTNFNLTGANGITVVNQTIITGNGATVSSVGLSLPVSVFSVTVSPIVGAGTLTAVLVDQVQRTFFAGPISGSNAPPTFRSIGITDLPSLPQGGLYVGTGLGSVTSGSLNGYNGITITSDSAGTINITGSGGTITNVALTVPSSEFSVSGSPLTGTGGTITVTKANQAANQFWAGPVSGASAQPTFRNISTNDLIPLNMQDGQLLIGSSGGAPVVANLLNGSNIVITNTPGGILISSSINASAIGTVYSVGLSLPGSIFSVSGSPVTVAGTLTGSLITQLANTIWAGPTSGAASVPTFRYLVLADLPILTNGQIYIGQDGNGATVSTLTAGTGISISNTAGTTTISTAISIGLALPASLFSVSGTPVTSVGTLTGSLVTQSAGLIFAGPSSGPASVHTFRSLVATDLPALGNGQIYIGNGGTPTVTSLSAGSGITITPGPGTLTITNALGGTVTSVGLALPVSLFTVSGSPVTGAGTLTGALVTQSANLVFAGPTTGAATTPTFRSLVFADIPSLDASIITTGILPIARGGTNSGTALSNNRIMVSSGGAIVEAAALTDGQLLIGATGAAPVAASLTAGTGISIAVGAGSITITNTASGSVTSVGLALPAVLFSVSGSPVTGAGTLTGSLITQTANTIFAGPTTGVAATPTFRALVAADIPSLDTSKLTTGILPIARGGTNSGTALTNNRIMVSSGGAIVVAAALTNGQLLIGSTGAAPVAAAITGTTNQVNVAVGAGTITLSTPQNIHTGATPTFASETLTATTNQLTLGTTNTLTISSTAPSASRIYTIPDAGANANFVLDTGGALTITNTATTGQALIATGTNTASWQTNSVTSLTNVEVSSSTPIVTFSNPTYVLATSMTMTLAAGTWHVWFSSTISTSSASGLFDIQLFNGVTGITHTNRQAGSSAASYPVETQANVISDGVNAITLQWRFNSGSGTANMGSRSMFAMRIG